MNGAWLAKAEYALPALSKESAAAPKAPEQPAGLLAGSIFNGMIHPLTPFTLTGVIWYQGESNTGRAYEYRTIFPMLIDDWRQRFQRADLPFYFCQIANYLPKLDKPGESAWAELRESQTCALKLPSTGQAVLIDLGESADAHFRNKKDAGDRLARIALAKLYGKDMVFSGPVYRSMNIEGATIRLSFDQAEGGLKPGRWRRRMTWSVAPARPRRLCAIAPMANWKASRSAARTTNGPGPTLASMGMR